MAWWSKLKEVAKKVKEKVVDVAKSFAPGGVTPSQAITGKTGDPKATFVSNIKKTASTIGKAAKRDIEGKTMVSQPLIQGTVPLGPAGATAGFATVKEAAAIAQKFGKGTTDLARQFPGVSKAVLNNLQKQKDVKTATNLLKGIKPGASAFLNFGKTVLFNLKANPVKWVAGITLGGVYTAKEFLWDPGVLASWAAVDNVAGLVSFTSKNINAGYADNSITLEEGEEFYTEAFAKLDSSEAWVRRQMRINPLLLWGAGKQMLLAVDTSRVMVTTNKQIFDDIDPEELSYQEQKEINDIQDTIFFQARSKIEAGLEITKEEIEILELRGYEISTQEEVNAVWESRRDGSGGSTDISGDIAKRDEAKEAEFRERTLLFEAIRIRNAGQTLTPEQMTLLEKYGLQSTQIKNQYEQPSQLSFGLL